MLYRSIDSGDSCRWVNGMYGSDGWIWLSAFRKSSSQNFFTVIIAILHWQRSEVDVEGKSEPTTAAMSKQKQERKNKKSKRKARMVSDSATVDVPDTSGFRFSHLPSLVWTFIVYLMGFVLFWRKLGTYSRCYCPLLMFRPKSKTGESTTEKETPFSL